MISGMENHYQDLSGDEKKCDHVQMIVYASVSSIVQWVEIQKTEIIKTLLK